MYDLLIKNGMVVDGSGAPRQHMDVAVSGGKIAAVEAMIPEREAKEVVDASGLIVAPGFIDCHSHSDMTVLAQRDAANVLEQGVTLEVTGHCGVSVAPVPEHLEDSVDYAGKPEHLANIRSKGGTFRAFREEIENMPLPADMVCLIGHGNLRRVAMGYADRRPTVSEMDRMKSLLREAMENGAMGFSTGLIYPPGSYSETEELVELAKVAAEYGGIYASHIRNEGDRVVESVQEAIDIGARAGLPVLISHHKVSGKRNRGKSVQTLQMIADANARGQKVFLDQYPYDGGSTSLLSALPPQYCSDGEEALLERLRDPAFRKEIRGILEDPDADFQNLIYEAGFDGVLLSSEEKPEINGLSLTQLAQQRQKDPYEAMFDLLVETRGNVSAIYRIINLWDLENILKYPRTMTGIDGMHAAGVAQPSDHPRFWATYPYLIGHFCRDSKVYNLETCIHRFTGLPAQSLGFANKGLVQAGKDADLVLFDFDRIAGNASYGHADIPNEGIAYVYVNGVESVRGGKITGKKGGRFIPCGH